MTSRCRIAVAVPLMLLVACGSSSPTTVPTLMVSPTATTVIVGGTAVAFSATLTGSTSAIGWTLTGPGTISSSSGTTTSYTPPASVASSTSATVTATAGTLVASATITINPPPTITVTGNVYALNGFSIGVPGVAVTIGTQSTVTDANGNFTISNVTAPYTLTTVVSTPNKLVVVYLGLTRPDPKILSTVTATPKMGTVTGNVSGGDSLPTPPMENTLVAWGSPETTASTGISTAAYSLNFRWGGPTTTTGNLHALQFVLDATGNPTAYKGYATVSGVTVASSGTTGAATLAMTAPSTATVGGNIIAPTSYVISGTSLSVGFADKASIFVGSINSTTASFSYLVPSNISSTATIVASATLSGVATTITEAFGIAPGTSNADITLVSPPLEILPADSGTGITTTTPFSWTAFAGGVHGLVISPSASTDPQFIIFTAGTTTTIPDLSAQGVGLPSGATYHWQVLGIGPFASMDVFAGETTLLPTGNLFNEAQGTSRSFTTQ